FVCAGWGRIGLVTVLFPCNCFVRLRCPIDILCYHLIAGSNRANCRDCCPYIAHYNAALSNTLIRAIPACPDSCPVLTEPRPPSPIFSECPHKRRTSSECPWHRRWAETAQNSSAQQFQQSSSRRRNL